jgi:hypothetical protein
MTSKYFPFLHWESLFKEKVLLAHIQNINQIMKSVNFAAQNHDLSLFFKLSFRLKQRFTLNLIYRILHKLLLVNRTYPI